MNRKIGWLGACLLLVGCSCQDRYDGLLKDLKSGIQDVRPKYERALRESKRDPRLIENDLKLVDEMSLSIQRVLDARKDETK